MKNLKAFKEILIGFLLGILISGAFLLGNSIHRNRSGLQNQPLSSVQNAQDDSKNLFVQSYDDKEKININTASITDLLKLPGIGEAKANSIIDFRVKYGSFEEIEELSYVSGIGDKLLESLREMVTIGHD